MVFLRASAAVTYGHPLNATEESALRNFRLSIVDLSDNEMRLGRAVRDTIISECEALNGSAGFPLLLAGQGFGAGSFGRRTQPRPLDDVDLYVVLNAGGAQMHDGGSVHYLDGNTAGPFVSDATLKDGPWISANLVLNRFETFLSSLPTVTRYAGVTGINSKAQCAYIRFDQWGLNIDISPVVCARSTNTLDRYYMPQGRNATWWKATNPKADQDRLSTQNQRQGELVLPAIRMLKWWNANLNAGRLKGIHLEVMAERALEGFQLEGLAQALHVAFEYLPTQLQSGCPDPTGLGANLDIKLNMADRWTSVVTAQNALESVRQAATNVASNDVLTAFTYWSRVFPGV